MSKRHFIVVLSDGETFTELTGCQIIELTSKGVDSIELDTYPKNLEEDDIVGSLSIEDYFGPMIEQGMDSQKLD
jgi:hypothetical protein